MTLGKAYSIFQDLHAQNGFLERQVRAGASLLVGKSVSPVKSPLAILLWSKAKSKLT